MSICTSVRPVRCPRDNIRARCRAPVWCRVGYRGRKTVCVCKLWTCRFRDYIPSVALHRTLAVQYPLSIPWWRQVEAFLVELRDRVLMHVACQTVPLPHFRERDEGLMEEKRGEWRMEGSATTPRGEGDALPWTARGTATSRGERERERGEKGDRKQKQRGPGGRGREKLHGRRRDRKDRISRTYLHQGMVLSFRAWLVETST